MKDKKEYNKQLKKIRGWNGKHRKGGICKNGESGVYDAKCMMCSLIMKLCLIEIGDPTKNLN